MVIKINESSDSFRVLRESGAYYIDKTMVIKEYLEEQFKTAMLFTRPRRFGKTMTMTMFREFLDIRKDSRDIFDGLEIMKHEDIIAEHMNRYPVVFLSLKEVYGQNIDSVCRSFKNIISTVCKEHAGLLGSDKADDADKILLDTLRYRKGSIEDTEEALDLLTRMLHAHYGRKAFVLIDEYDVPMAKTQGTPAYDPTREMIERMLSYVCKTNDHVRGVILTGCLYTVKNSSYTGVNNIVPYTVLSPAFASAIGFSDDDVRKLLSDAGLSDRYDMVAEWYDGYLFGREKMYCPWDVLRYVASVLDGSYSEVMGPESYWINTSDTTLNLIYGFFGKTAGVTEIFEQLLAGKSFECVVNENLPYHSIHENGDNLWSALVETGYLTKAVKEKAALLPLRIPNKEIQDVFRQEVWSYFKDKVDNIFVRDLVSALWAGETGKAEEALGQILEATLSFYHEYHEYSYHLILDGFFTGLGYPVLSEAETGYGRSDLIILDPIRNRCLLLELKHVDKEREMESALEEAGSQILDKKYESRLVYQGYRKRIQYAMAFCGKNCRIGEVTRMK